MYMLVFTKVILKMRAELWVYRARYGIWVKPLLCRGSRSWCWCRGSIIWLSRIRACISRLGASDLPKCSFKNNIAVRKETAAMHEARATSESSPFCWGENPPCTPGWPSGGCCRGPDRLGTPCGPGGRWLL